jgi:hypothetical protein
VSGMVAWQQVFVGMLPARSLQPLGEKIHECADLGGWARPAGKDRVYVHRVEIGTDGIIAYGKSIPITRSVRIRRNCCQCSIACATARPRKA